MGQISNDLIKFKDSVSQSLSSMNTGLTELKTKVSDLSTINNSAKDGINSYYSSNKLETVSATFESLKQKGDIISQCLSGTISGILSDCSSLLTKIGELEKINSQIADKNSIINNSEYTDEQKNSARNDINKLNSDFDKLEKEAEELLATLKSTDDTIGESFTSMVDAISEMPTGASFKLEEFVVNGKKMLCYVYKPEYSGDVGKLPLMMYMYGMDIDKNHGTELMLNGGLGKLISEGKAKPSGVVVIPYVQNGRLYEDRGFQQCLADLPLVVAQKYNCDEERISLGGTSYGAVTAYRLVKNNPGRYSALVTAYGAGDITDEFKNLKIYNYTGRGGGNHTDLNYIKSKVEEIKRIGGDVTFKQYDDTWNHTNTGTRVFSEYVKDDEGNDIPIYEAAMRTRRKKGLTT